MLCATPLRRQPEIWETVAMCCMIILKLYQKTFLAGVTLKILCSHLFIGNNMQHPISKQHDAPAKFSNTEIHTHTKNESSSVRRSGWTDSMKTFLWTCQVTYEPSQTKREPARLLKVRLPLPVSCSCDQSRTSRQFRSSRSCAMRRRWLSCFSWWSPASCCAGRRTPSCPWWRPSAGRAWSPQQWPLSRRSLPSPVLPTTPLSTSSWAGRWAALLFKLKCAFQICFQRNSTSVLVLFQCLQWMQPWPKPLFYHCWFIFSFFFNMCNL